MIIISPIEVIKSDRTRLPLGFPSHILGALSQILGILGMLDLGIKPWYVPKKIPTR
jgi:hypothetical protein